MARKCNNGCSEHGYSDYTQEFAAEDERQDVVVFICNICGERWEEHG